MNWKINQIIKGKKIYSRLQRMSYNHRIYISQHPAIGDAYLMGSYLKTRLNRQDILTLLPSKFLNIIASNKSEKLNPHTPLNSKAIPVNLIIFVV